MMPNSKMTAAFNFRVPQKLRDSVDGLAKETGWDASDIGRMALMVFWPQISAIVRANEPSAGSAENVEQLREMADLLQSAKRLGLDLRAVLVSAVEQKLAASSGPVGES